MWESLRGISAFGIRVHERKSKMDSLMIFLIVVYILGVVVTSTVLYIKEWWDLDDTLSSVPWFLFSLVWPTFLFLVLLLLPAKLLLCVSKQIAKTGGWKG